MKMKFSYKENYKTLVKQTKDLWNNTFMFTDMKTIFFKIMISKMICWFNVMAKKLQENFLCEQNSIHKFTWNCKKAWINQTIF